MERKIRILLLLAIALGALAPRASAQTPETLSLDLASMIPDGVTTRPGGRDVTYAAIVISNVIPRFNYNVDVALEEVGIRPLSLAAFRGQSDRGQGGAIGEQQGDCKDEIDNLINELDAVETEKAVSDVGAASKLAASATCKAPVWKKFLSLTERRVEQSISVRSSQTLTVTVSRPDVKFTIVYPGIARGEWRTSYGFFFVPDRDERYFANEENAGTPGAVSKIKKDGGREEFDFVPTIVFTFFPNSAGKRAGIGGLTAGLGYDLEKPFVFGGFSWAYNENIIFTGGAAFHRQSRLRGKYHVGDIVSRDLEPDQLVEDTYGPNVYVGISFRFAENIHEKRAALLEARAEADEAAAAAKAKAKKAEEESKLRAAACTAQADADEAAAKVECKEDAVCIAKVEKETAAKKTKCAVTELERVKAEKAEQDKQVALDKAEERATCEAPVIAKHDKALSDCSRALETCKKNAANAAAVQACERVEADCKTDAAIPLAEGKKACRKP